MTSACARCGEASTPEIVDAYPYTESGLDHIVLNGVEQRNCPQCKESVAVVLPMQTKLHMALAISLVSKRSMLTGKEIRFIRQVLGYSEFQMAIRLYSDPAELQYLESKDAATYATTDRLIRALFILKAQFCGLWPKTLPYEDVDEMFASLPAQRTPQCRLSAHFNSELGDWIVEAKE